MRATEIQITSYPAGDAYRCAIKPADGAWAVFVDAKGRPSLWLRVPFVSDPASDEQCEGYMEASAAYAAGIVSPAPLAQMGRDEKDPLYLTGATPSVFGAVARKCRKPQRSAKGKAKS